VAMTSGMLARDRDDQGAKGRGRCIVFFPGVKRRDIAGARSGCWYDRRPHPNQPDPVEWTPEEWASAHPDIALPKPGACREIELEL